MNILRWYKIDNNVISWIGSSLTNRLQRVRLEDSFSNWAKVLSRYILRLFDRRFPDNQSIYPGFSAIEKNCYKTILSITE